MRNSWSLEDISVCLLNIFSCIVLCVNCQAPLSIGFSRQGYWSGLLCPPPGDLPDPRIEPGSLTSPALAGRLFNTSTTWEAPEDVSILGINSSRIPMPICYFTLWITNPFAFWMGCNIQGPTQLWVKTTSSREVHPTSTEGPENHCFGDHVGISTKTDHNVQDRQLDPPMKWDSWWEQISVPVALRSVVPTLRLLRLWM